MAALPVVLGLLAGALPDQPDHTTTYTAAASGFALQTSVVWPERDDFSPLPHTVFGEPRYAHHDPAVNLTREYSGFAVYYDAEMLAPRWTAIKLTREMTEAHQDVARLSRFKKDPEIEAAGYPVTVHEDYNNPPGSRAWARGHMVQFDDARGWGEQSGEESFYTSNVAPQLASHNSAGWLTLEKTCTEFARDYEVVWVYTGPVYDSDPAPFAPGRRVPNPSAFYKIAVSPGENGSVDVQAFLMPHEPVPAGADMSDYLVTIDAIEAATDIDFLPELSDDVEESVESTTWELWPDLPNEL